MSLARIKALIKKELIQLKRDRTTFGMVLAIPLLWLIMFGYAINMDPKNLSLAINSRDNSQISRSIVASLANSGY
ncbi:MAG: ABC transporter permease, partial [Campylobacter sp.]|nr:ABC transporter permease [Campylobacter sp.]